MTFYLKSFNAIRVIIRELHIVNDLKTKMLLNTDIMSPDVTTSVLNKEGLPGTSATAVWAKRSGGTLERLTRRRRSDVPEVPPHTYMSLPRR